MKEGRPFFTLIGGIVILCILTAGCREQRFTDVEFVATPQPVVNEMLKMAQVTKDDVVYDLGCGEGRIVITAAHMFGARGVGVELDPHLIKIGNERARQKGVQDRVKFKQGDFFQADLSEATVVSLYLTPELNVRLLPKLFKELRPGARVVTNDFNMGEWRPDDMGRLENVKYEYPDKIYRRDAYYYFWKIPGDVAGRWKFSLDLASGRRDCMLRLSQKFQQVSGAMILPGREQLIADARLSGDQISFTVLDETASEKTVLWFKGRATGKTMEGMVEIPQGETAGHYHWLATREK